LVKFGTLELPHVLTIKQQVTRTYLEVPLPYRAMDYKADLGGQGSGFTIDGYVQSADSVAKAQIDALANGVPLFLDLEEPFLQPFDNVFRYQATPAWTDDTALAHLGGTPFSLMAATSDYLYFGYHEKFNKLQFLLSTMGLYGALMWEYSQGNGAWQIMDYEFNSTFPGSSVNPALWTAAGTVTVASGAMSVFNWSSITSVPTFPLGFTESWVMSIAAQWTDSKLYPIYIDSNDYIEVYIPYESGMYFTLTACSSGVTTTVSSTTQIPYGSQFTLTITATPTAVNLYLNGTLIATVTTNIPSGVGTMMMTTGGGNNVPNVIYSVTYATLGSTLTDSTNLLSQNGAVSFPPPSDWEQDTVNGVANRYWIRVLCPNALTTAAIASQILMNPCWNCIMLNPLYTYDPTIWDYIAYELTFQQQENPIVAGLTRGFDPAGFDPAGFD
jgi:hypothetical protein